MARIERGNVVLNVKDNEIQHYLKLGYKVVDEVGNVLQSPVPVNLGELQKAYVMHEAKINELENTIVDLTAQLTALKSQKKSASTEKKSTKKAVVEE